MKFTRKYHYHNVVVFPSISDHIQQIALLCLYFLQTTNFLVDYYNYMYGHLYIPKHNYTVNIVYRKQCIDDLISLSVCQFIGVLQHSGGSAYHCLRKNDSIRKTSCSFYTPVFSSEMYRQVIRYDRC